MDKRPRCVKSDASKFVSNMSLRSLYAGQISGMLVAGVSKEQIIEKLTTELWNACRSASGLDHHSAVWRATAMLVSTTGVLIREQVK